MKSMDVLRAQKFKLLHTLKKVVNILDVYKERDIINKLNVPSKDIDDLINKINEIEQRLTQQ